jgi:hypothetical protein
MFREEIFKLNILFQQITNKCYVREGKECDIVLEKRKQNLGILKKCINKNVLNAK